MRSSAGTPGACTRELFYVKTSWRLSIKFSQNRVSGREVFLSHVRGDVLVASFTTVEEEGNEQDETEE